MVRAMSYIRSHRRAMGDEFFAHVACGLEPRPPYSLYPQDISSRIFRHIGAEEPFFHRNGIAFQLLGEESEPVSAPSSSDHLVRLLLLPDRNTSLESIAARAGFPLVVTAFGREPETCRLVNVQGDTVTVVNLGTTGRYIGVADFTCASDFTVRTVDIAGFPADAEYLDRLQELSDSFHAYFSAPVSRITETLRQREAFYGPSSYTGWLHRFQREAAGCRISLFACPVSGDSLIAGRITPRDILRRFRYENQLVAVSLSGKEIEQYLEYVYAMRYSTMRRTTDNLLRMQRGREGDLQLRTAVYHLDEAEGICYRVDVSRPPGRRIRITAMADGSPFDRDRYYTVAVNSHRLSKENNQLARGTGLSEIQLEERILYRLPGDYRQHLLQWLSRQPQIVPENPDHWQVIPETFLEAARQREMQQEQGQSRF
ncbi:MAG: 5'-nucleotidase C-terminal domain-containing protein [Rikenellaceae bacterium]|nr:5'-nucleotidase C-terminal domain-containing protein [Rikenellaceae bacterium]